MLHLTCYISRTNCPIQTIETLQSIWYVSTITKFISVEMCCYLYKHYCETKTANYFNELNLVHTYLYLLLPRVHFILQLIDDDDVACYLLLTLMMMMLILIVTMEWMSDSSVTHTVKPKHVQVPTTTLKLPYLN